MSKPQIACWICGKKADSGEHKIKKTDLAKTFRSPNQKEPLFFHTAIQKNIPIGSLDSKILKSKKPICSKCNNETTQPFDLSWEILSDGLLDRLLRFPKLDYIRANRVIKYDTRRHLLNVHLFWVKSLGCMINDEEIPIDLRSFSASLLLRRNHPDIYLQFGRFPVPEGMPMVGRSKLIVTKEKGGSLLATRVLYHIANLEITVSYLPRGFSDLVLENPWHPRHGTSKFKIIA